MDTSGWIPDRSVLVTTTVLNTRISEVENKIPDTSALMTTAVLITKISENDNNILMILNILLLENLMS